MHRIYLILLAVLMVAVDHLAFADEIATPSKSGYQIAVQRRPEADVSQYACKIRFPNGMGSGVNTAKGVVTCWHVVAGQSQIDVTCGDETARGTVLFYDQQNDLAVMSVAWKQPHPTAELAESPATKGDAIKSSGRCKDGTINVEDHTCLATSGYEVRFENPSNAGRSGAGLFDAKGKLVGVIHGNAVDVEPCIGLATGVDAVRYLVGNVKDKPVSAAATKPATSPAVQNCPNGQCPLQVPQYQYFRARR